MAAAGRQYAPLTRGELRRVLCGICLRRGFPACLLPGMADNRRLGPAGAEKTAAGSAVSALQRSGRVLSAQNFFEMAAEWRETQGAGRVGGWHCCRMKGNEGAQQSTLAGRDRMVMPLDRRMPGWNLLKRPVGLFRNGPGTRETPWICLKAAAVVRIARNSTNCWGREPLTCWMPFMTAF